MPNGIAEAVVRRPLARRVVLPVAAFVGVVGVGVAGFLTMTDAGVVEAAFWLLDPGSIDHYYRTHVGPARLVKAYAVVVTSGMILAGLWIGETVLSAAFGGQIREELDTMQTKRAIADADEHVVICGYGMFGQTVARRSDDSGQDVVVIERDEGRYRDATSEVLAIQGDARREDTLRESGIEDAETVVAAIDDSNVNIQIAIAASQLAPDVRLVVRVGSEMYETLARRAGADEVVIPEVVSGEQVSMAL